MLDKDRSTVHRCGTLILGVFLEKMSPPTSSPPLLFQHPLHHWHHHHTAISSYPPPTFGRYEIGGGINPLPFIHSDLCAKVCK